MIVSHHCAFSEISENWPLEDRQTELCIKKRRREMAVQPKRLCLFNCDNTCDLKKVEEFLLEVDEKYKYKISVDSIYFSLRRMAEMVETTLPTMKMDFAIFVVHANESRLSINEDNAGIGYARLYKALLRATGEF